MTYIELPDDKTRQVSFYLAMEEYAARRLGSRECFFTWQVEPSVIFGRNQVAEREVNSYLTLIKQQNIRNWTDQDYLSMTALKFAIANVGMRQSRELDSEDLRRLEAIGEEIDSCLNDPTR